MKANVPREPGGNVNQQRTVAFRSLAGPSTRFIQKKPRAPLTLVHVLQNVLIGALTCNADLATWTNRDSGNWNIVANWSPNQVPSASDTVIITNEGTYAVTLNVDTAIAGLVLGGVSGTQTLTTTGRTLTLDGDATIRTNGVIVLSGGTLSGNGRIHLEGTITWGSGVLDTNVSLIVAPAGRITIASSGSYNKYWKASVTNAGTIIWTPNGNLLLGGILHNLTNAVFDIQTGGGILASGTDPILINEGTLRRTLVSAGTTFQVPLINSGTVDVQTGRLELPGGSVLNDGSSFTGAGTVGC